MAIPTLLEFASDKMLIKLLVKERAKCRRRNRGEKHHHLDKDSDISELSPRKTLSRLMPPRGTWVRPSKRAKLRNGAIDTSKNAEKALLLTIARDTKLQREGATFGYLDEQQAFFRSIRSRLSADSITFQSPNLLPILKDTKQKADGTLKVICRPLSVYSQLDDKIILALVSRYLTRYFDRYLHKNILSYRPARDFGDKKHYVTDFNDGIRLISAFREAHASDAIYAADCDIKKFYDIIPHPVVRDCFRRLLDRPSLSNDGKTQVMRVIDAYLASYNFYTQAWQKSQQDNHVFDKVRRRLHDANHTNEYQLDRADEIPPEESVGRGVPQGGSLSLLVANIVLNDVDSVFTTHQEADHLFIRYCDDMILLHTDYDACCRLMQQYAASLNSHGLLYHPFKSVSEGNRSDFWHVKSHHPFLWGDGEGNCNRYIGFLGYEMRRDGRMRLRKSNIKRFEEKFQRLRYAIHRYSKRHTQEETLAHQKRVFDNALDGIKFYEAFDEALFKRGSQYHYLEKLRNKAEQKFAEMPNEA